MKNLIIFTLLGLLIIGCSGPKGTSKPAIKIGKIQISPEEFERSFEASSFFSENRKKDFLNSFIARKLILLEAERQGLDKDPAFLQDVQSFWEQSLLKLTLDKKIKELTTKVSVTEDEIKAYYQANKDKEFADKEYDQVYDQIKWFLLRAKQQEAIKQWVLSLKDDSKLYIDYELLGIER